MDMKQSSVLKVLRVLSILQRRQEWEVRLTGFIALKYAVAIRTDIVAESTLPSILDSIILGYVLFHGSSTLLVYRTKMTMCVQLLQKHCNL